MSEWGPSVRGAPHLQQRSLAHPILVQHTSEPLHDLPARLLEAELAPRFMRRDAGLDVVARSQEVWRSRAKLLGCDPPSIAERTRQGRRPGVEPRRLPDRVAGKSRGSRLSEASLHSLSRPQPHLLPSPRAGMCDARGLTDTQCCLVEAYRSFRFDYAADPFCQGCAHE